MNGESFKESHTKGKFDVPKGDVLSPGNDSAQLMEIPSHNQDSDYVEEDNDSGINRLLL